MPTLRVFLLVALHHQWPTTQLDISNAFLHGHLSDTVLMKQPPGFHDVLYPHHVCRLKKAIYGLKQSPRQWYATLSAHLQDFGFQFSLADPSLLTYHSGTVRLYILIYVDDILLTGNDQSTITRLMAALHSKFLMQNLGSLSQFLGIHVTPIVYGVHLHQAKYARTILLQAGMQNCKPVITPSSPKKLSLSKDSGEFSNMVLYRQLAGSLQYLTLTSPDIAFSVQQICLHMHRPLNSHFDLLKRLLRYIQGTLHHGLTLYRDSLTLHSYTDSDLAGDCLDRKSVSGNCHFLGKSLIFWQVKKQQTFARSFTEAEYRALTTTTSEIIWLRRLLTDFSAPPSMPTAVYCANTSAIALAHNPVLHARTKHIEVDCHFIRDCIHKNQILVHHISTHDQLTDVFTKALSIARFKLLSSKLITELPSSV
ncbi:uncharacterized protein LOC110106744 [Dendrobium catenatum]|uniref:uncharacterized protein LOC110106744 n=1 Tax=Dendrobium catenatum TaxID=906689 RepID=UPI0009F6F629|nr:uncharacterized protein LOC110106744 [Dendrobium catenatum]